MTVEITKETTDVTREQAQNCDFNSLRCFLSSDGNVWQCNKDGNVFIVKFSTSLDVGGYFTFEQWEAFDEAVKRAVEEHMPVTNYILSQKLISTSNGQMPLIHKDFIEDELAWRVNHGLSFCFDAARCVCTVVEQLLLGVQANTAGYVESGPFGLCNHPNRKVVHGSQGKISELLTLLRKELHHYHKKGFTNPWCCVLSTDLAHMSDNVLAIDEVQPCIISGHLPKGTLVLFEAHSRNVRMDVQQLPLAVQWNRPNNMKVLAVMEPVIRSDCGIIHGKLTEE